MKITDVVPNQGNVTITGEITEKSEPREFSKFGKQGRVCSATIKDDSGTITLTLWNDEIDTFVVGEKVKITDGYVKEWQGEKQISAGKFGKIEKAE